MSSAFDIVSSVY